MPEIIRQPQATVCGDQWYWQEDKDRRLDFYILVLEKRVYKEYKAKGEEKRVYKVKDFLQFNFFRVFTNHTFVLCSQNIKLFLRLYFIYPH
jgi:hypothetical protein